MSESAVPNFLSLLEQASIALVILALFVVWVRRQTAAQAKRAYVPVRETVGRPLPQEDVRRPASAGFATDLYSRGPPGRTPIVPKFFGRRNT